MCWMAEERYRDNCSHSKGSSQIINIFLATDIVLGLTLYPLPPPKKETEYSVKRQL